MMRSLFAGVSGLRNHQVRMDVIGNNIANVNTVAFKSSRVTFKEGFSQLLQRANRPTGEQGGTNPMQVGLGMQIGSIDQLFTQGNVETTGQVTDLAIQGESLFVLRKGSEQFYTRAGNFQLDGDGRLVSPASGYVVQGRMAVGGTLQEGITDIQLPLGQQTAARATTVMSLAGNLDAGAPVFDTTTTGAFDATTRAEAKNANSYTSTTISVYDSLGTEHQLTVYLYKTAANEWTMEVDPSGLKNVPDADADGNPDFAVAGSTVFTFGADGTLDTTAFTAPTISFAPSNAEPVAIEMDPGSGLNGLTHFAGAASAVLRDQNGYTAGDLQSYTIDRTGTITGTFSNGTSATLAQIVLADFNNPGGLSRAGDNMYGTSANSGEPILGYALEGSQSALTSGALEMSNVDLAQEFTNMIVTQRGFQANGRVITSSDEMLQEIVNLKR